MYSILPLRPPGLVCATRPNARATPKSIIFTAPSNEIEHVLRRDVAVHDAERTALAVGQRRARSRARAAACAIDVRRQRRAERLLLARPPCAAIADSGLPCTSSMTRK